MSAFLGYHPGVKRLGAAAAIVAALWFTPALMAQVHGLPPTVTSLGPGGRVVAPLPPTATSLGPAGLVDGGFRHNGAVFIGGPGFIGRPDFGRHHHHRGNFIGGFPLFYPWGVPVMVAPYDLIDNTTDDEAQYEQPDAPTVFERGYRSRSAQRRYPERAEDADNYPAAPARSDAAAPDNRASEERAANEPATPQPASVLVFKDGHRLQVQNYAIVGDTLYDFTPGHQRKIQLSQLDVKATTDANDDLGLDFQVPTKAE